MQRNEERVRRNDGRAGDVRVLHVGKYYYPEVGGVEQVVRTLAEGCRERGHDVGVLASAAGGRGGSETVDGVPVRKVPSAGEVLSVPASPTFPLALRRESRDVDVLHFHLPHPLGVGSQLLAGRRDPAVVVTYHSDIVKQRAALRLYRPVLSRFLGRADRILPTSPRLLEHSDHLGAHAERCTVVPLSLDVEAFGDGGDGDPGESGGDLTTGSAPATDPDIATDPDRPTLLFVGRLSYYKGVEYLIDAMADVEADLLVVGDGERREALERRARERGVDGQVSFLGRVPDETLAACYAAADVFVLPSVEPSEAFGVVQLEAMAAGLPVVNTDLPTGVPWVSPHGETGLTVRPRDAAALADALSELVEDPDRRARFGAAARERVAARFDRERMLDRVEAVYEDVVDG